MLKIERRFIQKVRACKQAADLYEHLQAAIELEHATIPPYLTAMYSIKPDRNQEAEKIIRSVVVEEMLHMVIAANVLNAIGGHPEVNKPDFIPTYPGTLPMNVGDGLVVGMAPVSKEVVKNVFMKIEEPEEPIDFPSEVAALAAIEEEYGTIGQFYQAIIDKIQELGNSIFIGDPSRQVVNEQWFPSDELFPITDVDTAVAALTLIVEQGEGTSKSPIDPEGKLAHYYRFAQIYEGNRLVVNPKAEGGFSYTGEAIPLEEDGIWDLVANSKASLYASGTKARRLVDQFNYSYTNLLNVLHETLNGYPDRLNTSMGVMYELKLQAQLMAEIEYAPLGKRVAPAFEYATVNAPVTV